MEKPTLLIKNAENDSSRRKTPIVIELQISETTQKDRPDASPNYIADYLAYYLVRFEQDFTNQMSSLSGEMNYPAASYGKLDPQRLKQ